MVYIVSSKRKKKFYPSVIESESNLACEIHQRFSDVDKEGEVKVNVQVYSLISSDFTCYPLVTGPVHSWAGAWVLNPIPAKLCIFHCS